jgi:ADP-heptose:LPS heptosyltransferase
MDVYVDLGREPSETLRGLTNRLKAFAPNVNVKGEVWNEMEAFASSKVVIDFTPVSREGNIAIDFASTNGCKIITKNRDITYPSAVSYYDFVNSLPATLLVENPIKLERYLPMTEATVMFTDFIKNLALDFLVIQPGDAGDLHLLSSGICSIKKKFPNSNVTLVTQPSYRDIYPLGDVGIITTSSFLVKDMDWSNAFHANPESQEAFLEEYKFDKVWNMRSFEYERIHHEKRPQSLEVSICKFLGVGSETKAPLGRTDVVEEVVGKKIFLIHPVSYGDGVYLRQIPLSTITKLCESLPEDITPVIVGGKEAMAYNTPNSINLATKTTPSQLRYLVSMSKVAFSIDSYIMHLCCSGNVPTIVMFGDLDEKHSQSKPGVLHPRYHDLIRNVSFGEDPDSLVTLLGEMI